MRLLWGLEVQRAEGSVFSHSDNSDMCLMGQPNAVDQQFLMACHLQAVWGALPLRFMTHVVVTTGATLSSTPDKLQVLTYSFGFTLYSH